MQLTQIEDLVHAAFAVDQTCTDRVALDLALSAQARLEAVVAGQRICLARALARLSVTPEADLAAATRSDRREAKRAFERGTVADAAPGFNQALNDGAIRPEHVDRLSGALGRLTLQQGDRLLEQPDLVDAAAAMSPEDFDRELKRRERALSNDDGQALFERQKRATRLDTWIDDDGMANWKLRVDPLTGVLLTILIRANAEAMFHSGQVPDGAPVLPRDRQAFVHAHALIGLLFGDGPKPKTG
ncbi:MAG TPA: hypothetical protein PKV27_09135, partial [Ilumatobacteraceae bacterium]|nr:hypothetical protein [Ilumatobacteraceae bacterium]